jgi:glucokinase
MREQKEYAIGIDLGGTKILGALIHTTGEHVMEKQCPTNAQLGGQSVIEQIYFVMDSLLAEGGISKEKVIGVGVATAGVIDSKRNTVVYANNLGWRDVPLGDLIYRRYQLPLRLCNDANAAAVAEWMWGVGKETNDLIYITVSTGIGAGIITGGKLVSGVGDSAGEFGHISINTNGPKCGCGNVGCLENYVSGTAIAKEAQARLSRGEKSSYLNAKDGSFDHITAKDVGEAAKQGDSFSVKLLREIGVQLGIGITNLIHLFNTEVLVFGGGVMNMADSILPTIEETVKEHCIPALSNRITLSQTILGSKAGIKGAAGLFFSKELDKSYTFQSV